MKLTISKAIELEWDNRCISDVIPGLAGVDYSASEIEVAPDVAREIVADCLHYENPRAVDATVGERSAYRALRRQIEKALP